MSKCQVIHTTNMGINLCGPRNVSQAAVKIFIVGKGNNVSTHLQMLAQIIWSRISINVNQMLGKRNPCHKKKELGLLPGTLQMLVNISSAHTYKISIWTPWYTADRYWCIIVNRCLYKTLHSENLTWTMIQILKHHNRYYVKLNIVASTKISENLLIFNYDPINSQQGIKMHLEQCIVNDLIMIVSEIKNQVRHQLT